MSPLINLRSTLNGDQRCACHCHPNWRWVNWGDRGNPFMSLSDVDALFVSERQQYFLFIEWKGPGESLPEGQRRCFEALARLPRVKVIAVRGMNGRPAEFRIVRPIERWHVEGWTHTDSERFQRLLQSWYADPHRFTRER